MIIGLSRPLYAKYNNNGGQVEYTDGGVLGRAVNVNVTIETATDNDFFSDNAKDCGDSTFGGGTVTFTPNDLTQEVSKVILGVQEQAITGITGITDTDPKELLWDNRQESPYLGFGFIVKHRCHTGVSWRGIILRKVQFNVPADAATTQGKTIEWQTPELTASIYRDDSEYETWKQEATFTSEAQAQAYIMARLGITAANVQNEDSEEEEVNN